MIVIVDLVVLKDDATAKRPPGHSSRPRTAARSRVDALGGLAASCEPRHMYQARKGRPRARRRDKVQARYKQGTSSVPQWSVVADCTSSSALMIHHVPEHVDRVISWT